MIIFSSFYVMSCMHLMLLHFLVVFCTDNFVNCGTKFISAFFQCFFVILLHDAWKLFVDIYILCIVPSHRPFILIFSVNLVV